MSYWEYFAGRRITVMGLGLLGGIGDIRFLATCGADLIVTDLKKEEELQSSLQALKEFPSIRYTLGRHELSDFENRDLIIKAPATPLDSPYVAHAKKNAIPVTMWAALFARFAREKGARVVGVTGTRGKTTTTAMIAHILEHAGKKVIQGGNLPGTSMLPHLPELEEDSYVVLELDSWKMQGFREEKISPDVGVFTTFYPDHLNYYQDDLDLYLWDKAEIFLHQSKEDTLVLGEQCAELIKNKFSSQIEARVVIARLQDVPHSWKLTVVGEHNRANASCALAAVRALDISDVVSREALESFAGVPGRFELVREVDGVKIYNDTTATTPEATIAALRALTPITAGRIILITGGTDKNLEVTELISEIKKHTNTVFLLRGSGTDHIRDSFPDAPIFNALKPAVESALKEARCGDAVLFSPAFTSFGMFKNEYDRGDQFMQAIASL